MPMVVRLVNDDSEDCRKALGSLLVLLLSRINPTIRLKLFSMVLGWFTNGRLFYEIMLLTEIF